MSSHCRFTINGCDVGLWFYSQSEAELLAMASEPDRMMLECKGYSNSVRRSEWLATRILARQMGVSGDIVYSQHGEPMLQNSDTRISFSHTMGAVAVAKSATLTLGVDVEQLKRNFAKVLGRYASEQELEWVNPKNQQQMALVWCAKEAIYKMQGNTGKVFATQMNLQQVSPLMQEGETIAHVEDNGQWMPVSIYYKFFNDYCLVLAYRGV